MTAGDDRPVGEDDLQALVDGRLSPERRQTVEDHLAAHPESASRVAAYRHQRDTLRGRLQFKLDQPIPARLRIANLRAERRRRLLRRGTAIAASAVWLVFGAAIGWYGKDLLAPAPVGLMATDAIAAHRTFVVEAAHPVEVDAAREEHMVQWLSKRLGRPLTVPDLRSIGFRLMGGRLLPAAEGPAAQFMYDDDRGVRLTLYVRVGESGETAFRFVREGRVASFYWIDQGFGYAVSAETDRDRLLRVAEAIYHQIAPAR